MSGPRTCRELLDRLGDYAAATDDDVDDLTGRVERVLARHVKKTHRNGQDRCLNCDWNWPCPTVLTLDGDPT